MSLTITLSPRNDLVQARLSEVRGKKIGGPSVEAFGRDAITAITNLIANRPDQTGLDIDFRGGRAFSPSQPDLKDYFREQPTKAQAITNFLVNGGPRYIGLTVTVAEPQDDTSSIFRISSLQAQARALFDDDTYTPKVREGCLPPMTGLGGAQIVGSDVNYRLALVHRHFRAEFVYENGAYRSHDRKSLFEVVSALVGVDFESIIQDRGRKINNVIMAAQNGLGEKAFSLSQIWDCADEISELQKDALMRSLAMSGVSIPPQTLGERCRPPNYVALDATYWHTRDQTSKWLREWW